MAVWKNNLTLENKDTYDEIDYEFDFSDWLAGANITAQTVTGTNITVASSAILSGNQGVTSRITGGTAGLEATISCRITTDEVPPRKVERSVSFYVTEL